MTEQWGYSNELYDTIAQFGLRRGATILDVGCGAGAAAEPFSVNGFPVTGLDPSDAMLAAAAQRLPNSTFVKGEAEALPFPDERFDVVISAQTYDRVDRVKALSEAFRVLRRGGLIAVWWKNLMFDDGVKSLRDEMFLSLGKQPVESGLTGGFREFYASAFTAQTLRVIPWRVNASIDEYLAFERGSVAVNKALGSRAGEYFRALEERIRRRIGTGEPTLSLAFIQYLYMAKKP